MKVLVPVKRVIDYNVKVRVKADWMAKRASAGRMAPRGFPRENKFK